MHQLENQLRALEAYIPKYNTVSGRVSAAPVGWHIEHTLLTIRQIIKAVRASDEKNFKPAFRLNRLLVFATGTIPRGRAKAPQSVQPYDTPDTNTLKESLYNTRKLIAELALIKPNQHFTHPYFGPLHKKHTLRFLQVHNRHHLKIIKEIIDTRQ